MTFTRTFTVLVEKFPFEGLFGLEIMYKGCSAPTPNFLLKFYVSGICVWLVNLQLSVALAGLCSV